ncbi:DUF7577 domain-containing protein [Halegenticoccus soli]|uniref:DUF7577 domain-containing protein n=1 Tax=Halegenticoccus soli TaxID=1985678 RepID=UPI000C6EF6AC|nr:zinc ribbon domain-containing protein [Halegenticoccus soli]
MELVFRLAVAAFVIVAPSALFLGLWRGLHALRDDRLIERMAAETGTRPADLVPNPARLLPDGERGPNGTDLAICAACGAPNPADVTFCHDCLSRVR